MEALPKDWLDMLGVLALPAGEQLKGAKGMDFYTGRLGLRSSFKRVRGGSGGLVDEHRDYRCNGTRHGRQVQVRPGYPRNPGRWGFGLGYAQDSEVLVRCAAPEFRATGNGKRLELLEGPPRLESVFAELDGAHRWKRLTVDSDGRRIRVHREMRMIAPRNIHDWTHDLWLAEAIADRVA